MKQFCLYVREHKHLVGFLLLFFTCFLLIYCVRFGLQIRDRKIPKIRVSCIMVRPAHSGFQSISHRNEVLKVWFHLRKFTDRKTSNGKTKTDQNYLRNYSNSRNYLIIFLYLWCFSITARYLDIVITWVLQESGKKKRGEYVLCINIIH